MSPDDVDSIVLELSHKLETAFGINFDLDLNYDILQQALDKLTEPFITRDRNYN